MTTKNKELYIAAFITCVAVYLFIACGCVQRQVVTTSSSGASVTNTVSVLDTNKVCKAIRDIVPPAVRVAVRRDSNCKPYLQQVAIVFATVANSGQYDYATLTNSLANISLRTLRTPEAADVEDMILSTYKAFLGDLVDAVLEDKAAWAKPVMDSISDAIAETLN